MGMSASVKNPWSMNAPRQRIDWNDIKARLELAAITTALLGPAPKRSGRRLLWPCPFHQDHDPSLEVDPAANRWKCWPCNLGGDAPALVMRLRGVGFPEAVRIVAELAGIADPREGYSKPSKPSSLSSMPSAARPTKAPDAAPDRSTGLSPADALALVEAAEQRLWTPEGAEALAYLQGRGLSPETIRHAHLGWTPRVMLPTSDGARFWGASGITIPWLDGDRLVLLKIRQPEGTRPKYAEAFRDGPSVFPSMASIQPGATLVVTEGEFDALLLGQELGELAAVVTLGSASTRPEGSTRLAMLRCPRWYVAHDADDAGDKAAAEWPARAIRVKPPEGKDWTDAHRAGIDLRRWWVEKWLPEAFDREERTAIMEFDGGLTRGEAERLAGVSLLREGLRPRTFACRASND
jgi:DNA primase